jgi:hypothetical protein
VVRHFTLFLARSSLTNWNPWLLLEPSSKLLKRSFLLKLSKNDSQNLYLGAAPWMGVAIREDVLVTVERRWERFAHNVLYLFNGGRSIVDKKCNGDIW